jgi:hypothetical protein
MIGEIKLNIYLNYDRILGARKNSVKTHCHPLDPGSANLPIGGFRRAIQENGVPRKAAI